MKYESTQIGCCTVICGDALEVLPHLERFDLALTDPPFGIGNFVQITGRRTGRGTSAGQSVTWNDSPPSGEFFSMLKLRTAHRIIFGCNFYKWRDDGPGRIVWHKHNALPNTSDADIASMSFSRLVKVIDLPWTNFTAAHKAETDHPCERPINLYLHCLDLAPRGLTSVLDPFAGSGSVAAACLQRGIKHTSIERDPVYYRAIVERLRLHHAQRSLPL